MKPTNSAARAWALLSGTRLTTFCLGSLIGLCLASEAGSAWLEWQGTFVAPAVGHWLRAWVIADSAHAPGFKLVLGILLLNFLGATVAAVRAALASEEASLQQEADEELLKSGLESRLGSEAFGALARHWARKNLGRVSKVRQALNGDQVLSIRRGRTSSWLKGIAHWALLGSLVGLGLMLSRGYQARTIVEEGVRVNAVEHVRGPVPADWKPASLGRAGVGAESRTYFEPGFEIERVPADSVAPVGSTLLHLYREGKLQSSVTLSPGRPARFEELTLHLLRYVPSSSYSVKIMVTDRANGTARRFSALGNGQEVDLEEFGFRVTEIRPETEESGAAVELEYREGSQPAQRFWIFADFPDYDFAHRKKSAQHFTLEAIRGRNGAEIAIGREPGSSLLWGGLLLAAGLFWVGLARPEERFWIKWNEKAGAPLNVEMIGWGARPLSFSPRFYRLVEQLESLIAEAENKAGADNAVART